MTDDHTTRERIDELLQFLPGFEMPGRKYVTRWAGGELTDDGALTFPYPVYAEDVLEFFRLAGQRWWADFGYKPRRAHEMLYDDVFVQQATLAQVRTMLTYSVRGERFGDGHWNRVLQDGRVVALLRRLAVLRDELEQGMGGQGPGTARRIEVVAYDADWPRLAQAEAERLRAALESEVLAVHHIGSTAIPGLPAKPTLDLLLEVRALEGMDAANDAMLALGYEARGENGIAGRRYFVKRAGGDHTHHVHAYASGHPEIGRHLRFRDYLRAHPGEAQAYGELKMRLARQFPTDPQRYTDGKDAFVAAIDEQAAAWAQDR